MPKPEDSENNEMDDASRVQSVVETANAEDEKDLEEEDQDSQDDSDEDAAGNDDDASDKDDSEDDESDDDDEEKEDKSDKKVVERKFKNLAADDDAGYIGNLEKAYENSSAEAIRLSNEIGQLQRRVDGIMSAVAQDPDLADKLMKAMGGEGGSTDQGGKPAVNPIDNPLLTSLQTEWQKKSETEVKEIVDANPELLSDPTLNQQVRHWMEVFSAEEYRANRRMMSGGEAMIAAMNHLGITDKRKKEQEVIDKSKGLAAPSRPQGARKPKPKAKNVSDAAIKFGAMMGVSQEKIEKYSQ